MPSWRLTVPKVAKSWICMSSSAEPPRGVYLQPRPKLLDSLGFL